MFDKSKISVKVNSRDDFSPTYDVIIGTKEFKNVRSTYKRLCFDCRYSSKCPFHFNSKIACTINFYDCLSNRSKFYNRNSLLFLILSILVFYFLFPYIGSVFMKIVMVLFLFILQFLFRLIIKKVIDYINNELLIKEIKKQKREEELIFDFSFLSDTAKLCKIQMRVAEIERLISEYDFKSCYKLTKKCIKLLRELIEIVSKNNSYSVVSYLFETQFPEVYELLIQYSKLISTNCVDCEIEKTLNTTMQKFLECLKSKRDEAILNSNKDLSKMNFKASASFIDNLLNMK